MAQKKLIKVELGNVNDAIKLANQAETQYKKTNSETEKAISIAKVALKGANECIGSMEKFFSLYEKLEDQFKQLGLDIKSYPEINNANKNLQSKYRGVLNLREDLENFAR
jgi:phenylalanyl-tRNA synthetase alpha subunit